MVDENETYAFETQDEKPVDEKIIVRTYDSQIEEKFTLKQLEEKIVRIEEQKTSLDGDIAVVQEKIDEAKVALDIA